MCRKQSQNKITKRCAASGNKGSHFLGPAQFVCAFTAKRLAPFQAKSGSSRAPPNFFAFFGNHGKKRLTRSWYSAYSGYLAFDICSVTSRDAPGGTNKPVR